MNKFSIIIPTMQKDKDILLKLIDELIECQYVGEIIIIDNSLKGLNYSSNLIKIITPNKNMFVNPAWNLGVKVAKFNYIGILNDDIIFPKNFFEQVYNFITNNECGLIGLDKLKNSKKKDFNTYPNNTTLSFEAIEKRLYYWGSAIFGLKENYYNIPEEMKVWCGDDYLFKMNKDNNKQNYKIVGGELKHLKSLTSRRPEFNLIKENDQKFYITIDPNFSYISIDPKLTLWEKIFSVKNSLNKKHKIIRIFGIKIKFKYNQFKKQERDISLS